MYTKPESDDAVRKVDQAKLRNKLILFDQGLPDRETPELLWSLYGVIDTNEIIVIARYRDRAFGAAGPSPLFWPAMANRIFGMDIDDRSYAGELADRLYSMVKQEIGK